MTNVEGEDISQPVYKQWSVNPVGKYISEVAEKTTNLKSSQSEVAIQLVMEPKYVQGKYDDTLNQFKAMLAGKFDLDDLVQQALNKTIVKSQMSKGKARSMFWELFKDTYLPPEDIGGIVDKTMKAYAHMYFEHLPNIYRIKHIGKIKEIERASIQENKLETTRWDFKLQSLKEHYQVKIVNFEGQANTTLEQIFEILSMNYCTIVLLAMNNAEMEETALVLSFAKQFLGGPNKDYFLSIANSLIQDDLSCFLEFFFTRYVASTIDFFHTNWSDSFRVIMKAAQDMPQAHQFMTAFRLALMLPEVRVYCMKKVEALGELFIKLKQDTKNTGNKQKEKKVIKSNITPKILIQKEVIDEILHILDLREFYDSICYNPMIGTLFQKIIPITKKYIEKRELDESNLSLVMLFLHIYGILDVYLCQLCHTVVSDHELRYQYIFMTEHITDLVFDVDYLESSMPTVAYFLTVLDYLNSLIPSIIHHMVNSEGINHVNKYMARYGQNIDILIDAVNSEPINTPASPFVDKICLVPVAKLNEFLQVLFHSRIFENATQSQHPTTLALLEVFIEELKSMQSNFTHRLRDYLIEDLSETSKLLVLITTNITSLYSEEQLSEMPNEIFKYLNVKGNYLDSYSASIEQITYSIAQSATSAERVSNVDSYLPLMLNKVRILSPMLVNSIQLDDDNKELLERMVDSCSVYMLWRLLSPIDFENTFSKDMNTMLSNMQYLRNRIDRLLHLKQIAKILGQNHIQVELELMKVSSYSKFVEEIYLKGFWSN